MGKIISLKHNGRQLSSEYKEMTMFTFWQRRLCIVLQRSVLKLAASRAAPHEMQENGRIVNHVEGIAPGQTI